MVLSLESGRQAAQRREWEAALETFHALDREEPLAPDDLQLLADAAWWAGRAEEAVDALERAYTGYVDASMPVEAAGVAATLAYLAFRRLTFSVASGWRTKAARLLEGVPETGAHASLGLLDVAEAVFARRDLERGVELADEVVEQARRTNRTDVEARALAMKGHALVSAGRWRDGLAAVDEAAATALSGGADLRAVSDVYCMTIAACQNLADFGRAAEWTDQAERFMSEHSIRGYPGVCQIHRASLKRMKGAWPEAEAQARIACEDLQRFHILDVVGFAGHSTGSLEGDDDLARIDLDAARSTLDRLGAVPDVRRVDDILRPFERPADRVRVTRTFVFTDIVTSTDLVGLIGDDRWGALLAWHDRELRLVFAEHGGVEVDHTGDGFFVAFDGAAPAIGAAVAIQRRLVDHRNRHRLRPLGAYRCTCRRGHSRRRELPGSGRPRRRRGSQPPPAPTRSSCRLRPSTASGPPGSPSRKAGRSSSRASGTRWRSVSSTGDDMRLHRLHSHRLGT